MTDRTLVYPGSEVKALGSGRVAGYLVRFGDPTSADVQGDYFTAETYFGRALKAGTDIVWHHGIAKDGPGAILKNSVIGDAVLTMKQDGLWAEGTLQTDIKGVDSIYNDVASGKVGWSSGSVDRLVQREPTEGKTAVKSWPIIEASLSYKPVDPRNKAIAIKALDYDTPSDQPVAGGLVEFSERLVADATEAVGLYRKAYEQRQAEGRNLSEPKRAALREVQEAIDALVREVHRPDPEKVAEVRRMLLASRL
jgi:hypothetical protein